MIRYLEMLSSGASSDSLHFLGYLDSTDCKICEMHSSARPITFVSVRSSQGNLNLFEITRASDDFRKNFRCNFSFNESENFSDSSLHDIFESENLGFFFLRKIALPGEWNMKN